MKLYLWCMYDVWCQQPRIRDLHWLWEGDLLCLSYHQSLSHKITATCACKTKDNCLQSTSVSISGSIIISYVVNGTVVFWSTEGFLLLYTDQGGHKEMSSILADQYRPRIWAQMRGEGGLSQWEQLCTRSPNKRWRSNSILNLWYSYRLTGYYSADLSKSACTLDNTISLMYVVINYQWCSWHLNTVPQSLWWFSAFWGVVLNTKYMSTI